MFIDEGRFSNSKPEKAPVSLSKEREYRIPEHTYRSSWVFEGTFEVN